MIVAVDAMGGDNAPREIVKGALLAARDNASLEVILVGDQAAIEAELAEAGGAGDLSPRISIKHTPDVIAMDDHPAHAVRRKRQSSLVVCGQMVKSGEAHATVSAGNTGAAMAIAILDIGRIAGIDRPALATYLPTPDLPALMIDAGANVDCSPNNLLQFALLGSVFAERVMKRPAPRVGLLNIGGEAGKGNELSKTTYDLLRQQPLNFVGNVEGKEVFEGHADVVVCDGFDGNVLLKSGEGVAELMLNLLRTALAEDPQFSQMPDAFRPIFKRLHKPLDWAEYGGAPLLGVEGVSVVAHGRSHARALANAVAAAANAAESGYVAAIRAALADSVGSPAV